MKKLKIDMMDLEIAFSNDQMSESEFYLDNQTGKVIMISSDDRSAAAEFFDESESEEGEDVNAQFEAWLEGYKCPEWQIDSIRDAFMLEDDSIGRFISIPSQDSHAGYNDMVDFAESVENAHLQELLSVALNGKGSFRRFKDVLSNHPKEQQEWYDFSDKKFKDRIMEWLESEDIELES